MGKFKRFAEGLHLVDLDRETSKVELCYLDDTVVRFDIEDPKLKLTEANTYYAISFWHEDLKIIVSPDRSSWAFAEFINRGFGNHWMIEPQPDWANLNENDQQLILEIIDEAFAEVE